MVLIPQDKLTKTEYRPSGEKQRQHTQPQRIGRHAVEPQAGHHGGGANLSGTKRQPGTHQQHRSEVRLKAQPQPWPLQIGLLKKQQVGTDHQPKGFIDSSCHDLLSIRRQHANNLKLVQIGVQFDSRLGVQSIL